VKRTTKIILGLLALWPNVHLLLVLRGPSLDKLLDAMMEGSDTLPLKSLMTHLLLLGISLLLPGISALLVVLIYFRHLFTSTRLDKARKAVWTGLLIVGTPVTLPFYWAFCIWPEPEEQEKK